MGMAGMPSSSQYMSEESFEKWLLSREAIFSVRTVEIPWMARLPIQKKTDPLVLQPLAYVGPM
jgi:hypothetical protein